MPDIVELRIWNGTLLKKSHEGIIGITGIQCGKGTKNPVHYKDALTILVSPTTNLRQSIDHVNGLVQDCSIFIANALKTLQSCTEPPMLSL